MYDLPGAKDREADKLSVLALLKTACVIVYDLETPINRVVHLRRKVENKHRPLLVCFESADHKAIVVSRSYLLHHHDQFKRVFIAPVPDRTVLEKHQRLVIQLRERKS